MLCSSSFHIGSHLQLFSSTWRQLQVENKKLSQKIIYKWIHFMLKCNILTFKDETTEQQRQPSDWFQLPSVQLDSLDLVHICHVSPCLCVCVRAGGSTPCVRAWPLRMRWRSLLMKASTVHCAKHTAVAHTVKNTHVSAAGVDVQRKRLSMFC